MFFFCVISNYAYFVAVDWPALNYVISSYRRKNFLELVSNTHLNKIYGQNEYYDSLIGSTTAGNFT